LGRRRQRRPHVPRRRLAAPVGFQEQERPLTVLCEAKKNHHVSYLVHILKHHNTQQVRCRRASLELLRLRRVSARNCIEEYAANLKHRHFFQKASSALEETKPSSCRALYRRYTCMLSNRLKRNVRSRAMTTWKVSGQEPSKANEHTRCHLSSTLPAS
jgi:hypothetical protein